MIEAVGSKVLKLVRTHIGPVTFGDLKIGTWRELEPTELASLQSREGNRAVGPLSNNPRSASTGMRN